MAYLGRRAGPNAWPKSTGVRATPSPDLAMAEKRNTQAAHDFLQHSAQNNQIYILRTILMRCGR